MMISTEMSKFLSSMDYPAHPHDLVREATRDGLDVADLGRLAELTPRSYNGKWDVLFELRWGRGGLLSLLAAESPVAV
jgi:hypothetical protein